MPSKGLRAGQEFVFSQSRPRLMPDGRIWIDFEVVQPRRLVGYRGTYCGVLAERVGDQPGIWFTVVVDIDDRPQQAQLRVLYQRAWFRDSPVWAVIDWHAEHGLSAGIDGELLRKRPDGTVIGACAPDLIAHAHRGLDVLLALNRGGTGGRRRLEDNPAWRALMQSIDEYMGKYPSATLENAVDRFNLSGLDDLDDELDAIASGEDPEHQRRAAAVAKLTRWLARWRNF